MTELTTQHPSRHTAPTARAQALAYLEFERPDLDKAERFLHDFGLVTVQRTPQTIYLRGTQASPFCYRVTLGQRPRFTGFGFTVDSEDALKCLSQVEGASSILPSPHPGGGQCVTLHDPSGFQVTALLGQTAGEALPYRAALPINLPAKTVRVNHTQRPPAQPPDILRLGHLVLEVADFQATCAWYTAHFGLLPSDVQVLPDGSPAVVFLRLDLGDTPADHHTLALAQGFMPCYSHSAYEVVDADAVGMGQRILREHGWRHAWGIGRHVLGSQIFDYWQDPWHAKHEHYCDGDLFTADAPMGVHPVSREAMSQWGQRMPGSFTRPSLTPSSLAALVRNLRRSPDLTLRKLITLARLFG